MFTLVKRFPIRLKPIEVEDISNAFMASGSNSPATSTSGGRSDEFYVKVSKYEFSSHILEFIVKFNQNVLQLFH